MLFTITLFGFVSTAIAHGTVSSIVANGVFFDGYNPSYQYITPAPVTVGWKIPTDLGNGFIAPDSFATSDIICHLAATNALTAAPIKAGQSLELLWTPWPTSHKGPVLDYLANCNGPCETVDKTTLEWFRIDAVGLIDKSLTDGYWATDQLIADNNTWTVVIPPTIAPGNYVLRHEIIALHSAGSANGAQSYPQCVNLAISSSGTATPAGVLATTFYSATDPGILFDLYGTFTSYTIPGPPTYSGGVTISQTLPPTPTASATGVYTV
ncbi:Endoglucanase [Lachnellula subtilissima]|uniref:Endoglucanase n=1 Tax=Lachnellula subtilissima TaxID=602034 RepID=A0A8H8RG56_9HELO|nr:Endoglucanase [Lachnellula subtilissima]